MYHSYQCIENFVSRLIHTCAWHQLQQRCSQNKVLPIAGSNFIKYVKLSNDVLDCLRSARQSHCNEDHSTWNVVYSNTQYRESWQQSNKFIKIWGCKSNFCDLHQIRWIDKWNSEINNSLCAWYEKTYYWNKSDDLQHFIIIDVIVFFAL